MSNWDTANVTDMSYMFDGCKSLQEIDAGRWNTSKVTDMSRMFYGVPGSFILHFSPQLFDTSNVEHYFWFMPDGFDWERLFE